MGGKTYKQQELEVLKDAAEVIAQELEAENQIKIPGFGKFYLSKIRVANSIGSIDSDTLMNKVNFRPFEKLKKRIAKKESIDDLF